MPPSAGPPLPSATAGAATTSSRARSSTTPSCTPSSSSSARASAPPTSPSDSEGFVDLAALEEAIGPETTVLTLMAANNEVGTLQPVAEAAARAKARNPNIVVHTDAVQAAGSVDITPEALGVDLLSLASHKLYGVKGAGLLYVRRGTPWQPQMLGGSQERERRAGTENVAGAFALAAAMELAWGEREERVAHYRRLRDRLLYELPERVPDTVVTGPPDPDRRLPNNFSCCFRNVEGESVLLALDMAEVAASSGSACTTGSLEPSHVLTAMGIDDDLAHASLRLTVGKGIRTSRSTTSWSSSRRSCSACGRSPRASPRSA